MLGPILISIGTFFEEVSDSIGKDKVKHHLESPYTMAFLSLFWAAIIFTLISVFKADGFVFKLASLPTFLLRAFLEVGQMYVSIMAIVKADRSTFSFVRTITIPFLLIVDLILGYQIGFMPTVGIGVIIVTLGVLFFNHGIKKTGLGFVLFSAINAVITISLFKYDITHFNSVAAEQLLINAILLTVFLLLAIFKAKENPLVFLEKPIFLLQSAAIGIGGVIESFGYNYGAASIMTAAKRSSAIFWSLLAGKVYFKEKHIIFKFAIFILLLGGFILLALN